jgi:hypothetical protein
LIGFLALDFIGFVPCADSHNREGGPPIVLFTQFGITGVVEMEQFVVEQVPEGGAMRIVSMDAIAVAKLVSLSEESEVGDERRRAAVKIVRVNVD